MPCWFKTWAMCNQPVTYAFRLLNNVEQNYTTTKWEALAMIYM